MSRADAGGREPRAEDKDANGNPTYEGQSAVSGLGPAGTAVLWALSYYFFRKLAPGESRAMPESRQAT